MEKKKNISSVGIMLLLYITLWSCNNNAVILYGGYAILMFFTIAKLFFSEKGAIIEMYTPTKQLFIFMCFCFASIFWALNKNFAFQKCIFICACVMLVIVMTNYFIRIKSVDSLLFTIAVMGIAMAVYVIIFEGGLSAFYAKATSSIGQANLSKSRVGGDINNVNFIGMQCGYSAVVLFYYALFKKRIYCYFMMFLPLIVTAASGSRKALLIVIIGVFLLMFFKQREQRNIQKYLKVLVGIFVVAFILRFLFSLDIMYTVVHRMEMSLNALFNKSSGNVDGSSETRFLLIKVGLEQFLRTPAFGVGLGNAALVNAAKINFGAYSHNDYIEHLVNGGLVGFLLYYRIFWYCAKNYFRMLKLDNDSDNVISFIIMVLVLISNFAMVTYYNSVQMYLFYILWISQIEIKKESGGLK